MRLALERWEVAGLLLGVAKEELITLELGSVVGPCLGFECNVYIQMIWLASDSDGVLSGWL